MQLSATASAAECYWSFIADEMIDTYIDLKMQEVTRLRMTTHPVEFDMYYSL